MTLIFNQEKYKELLCQYQPKVIKNEADNETALRIVEQLMQADKRTPEENELYDLLVTLIEQFEQQYYYPGATSTPSSMLNFLMEQQGFKPQDLSELLDSPRSIDEILQGHVKITKDQAQALGKFFKVDPTLFR
ncbi:MAG: transcriptional regulator [Cyanobacteria bacterium J06643_13]